MSGYSSGAERTVVGPAAAEATTSYRTLRDPGPGHDEPFDPSFKNGTRTRTTRLTAWLRRTSLDELPQLLNVLAGQMSIVGPRPVVAQELLLHYGPTAPLLLVARPGMTGLWTVNGRAPMCPTPNAPSSNCST